MLCPGGTEHAGGIGRWAGYMLEVWDRDHLQPGLEIVDTRGFGGWGVAGMAFAGSLLRLARLRLAGELGLIHANVAIRGSVVRKCIVGLFAWLAGVKLIVHLHAGPFFEFYQNLPRPARWAVRKLFTSAERVIVLGEIWRAQVVSVLGVPDSKITILYNAVRAPRGIARSAPPDGVCHIVMLGRLWAAKGVPELMQAFSSDTMRARSWRATLAGDGDVQGVAAQAAQLGLGDRIVCPGWLDGDAVVQLLQEADILVLPSRSENLPVAVIEALAYRVAVVTTPVGATPELVQDGVSALFVPVQDPDALAGALARLIDDPAERALIAANGHEVFKSRLDATVEAPVLADLYRGLIDGSPTAPR
jgi:glycosyltransferase involved in cell wall biosynthesis